MPATPADVTTRISRPASFKVNQLQDLVEVLPEALKATAGLEMTFQLSVELKGKGRPTDKVVAAVNALLQTAHKDLKVD